MNWRFFARLLPAWLALCVLHSAQAADEQPSVTLGGFGTLGAAYHEDEGLEYRRSSTQKHGARAGQLEAGVNSIIGVQANARSPWHVDSMVQAVSRQHADGTWTPELIWAFLRYAPNDDWQLRFGRLGLDTQLNADSRLIGYSLTTARARPEEFAHTPFNSIDGIDLSYRNPLGDALLTLKGYFGQFGATTAKSDGSQFRYSKQRSVGVNATLAYEGLQVRTTLGQAKSLGSGDLQSLVDALHSTGFASADAAADQLNATGRRTSFSALQAAWEQGPANLELSWLKTFADKDSASLSHNNSIAALAAYRLGDFKPYLGYARSASNTANVSTGLPSVGQLAILNAAVQSINNGAVSSQRALTFGVRYDVARNMDLKLQVDRIYTRSYRAIISRPEDYGYHRLTLFSASLDFIF